MGIAVDSKGDIFVSGFNASGRGIVDLSKDGGTSWKTVQSDFVAPQGLALDSSGRLWVDDAGKSFLYEFQAPYTGKPIRKIRTQTNPSESAIALGDHGKVVWGAVTFTASGQIEAFGLGQSAVSGRIVADTQATAGDFTTGIATVPASI